MKAILLIGAVTAILGGAVMAKFPQVMNAIPLVQPAAEFTASIGIPEAIEDAGHASRDVAGMVASGRLDGWHLIIIAVALLLARKTLMWVLK
ncbi:MAG: hypothetical protein AB1752_06490 [Candidatus Zixiibacteriota bacterium]